MPKSVDDKNSQGHGRKADEGAPPAASTSAPVNQADETLATTPPDAAATPPANTPPAGGATPPDSGATPPAGSGNPPPAPEGSTGDAAAQQGGAQGSTPHPVPPATGDNKPPAPPTGSGGKKRVKCAALKGKKIIVGKGEAVQIDENGFLEVEEKEAERLLSIPGYEEA